MRALRFAGPFAFLLTVPLLSQLSETGPLLAPLGILLLLLAVEQVRPAHIRQDESSAAFRLLPVLYILLQLAVTVWAARQASLSGTSPTGFASLAVGVGVCTGVFGVLAAHEMVHSRTRWQKSLGLLMLSGMTYRHFRIAHVYGHHRHAATPRDPSTARLGESFYAFLWRTVPAQLVEAWCFEAHRTRTRRAPPLHNRIARDAVWTALLYLALTLLWGRRAAGFLAAESMVAILVLELFNYIAHYGLARRPLGNGLEPLGDHHSWNSSGLGNLMVFNMGRHSDHHRAPAISYEGLRARPAPELPGGYAGSIVLALAPPLWRMVMDPRARAFGAVVRESRYAGGSHPAAAAP